MVRNDEVFERECAALISWIPGRRGNSLKLNDDGIDVVTKALKKQVPEKVTHEAALLQCCTCPSCKNVVDSFETWGESRVRVTFRYCHFCGQRLEWGGWQDELDRLIENRRREHGCKNQNRLER